MHMYIVYTIYYRGCFETTYFLYESAFCPHETSESPDGNRIFLKPLSTVWFFFYLTSLVNSCGRLKPNILKPTTSLTRVQSKDTFHLSEMTGQTRILVSIVQYTIFIKSPLCGSSDLIYKMEKKKEEGEKRLIYKSNYSWKMGKTGINRVYVTGPQATVLIYIC